MFKKNVFGVDGDQKLLFVARECSNFNINILHV